MLGTRDYVRKNGFTDVLIGLSGGIDSSLVAAIAVDALGAEHVHGVLDAVARTRATAQRHRRARRSPTNLGIDTAHDRRSSPRTPRSSTMLAPSFGDRRPTSPRRTCRRASAATSLMTISNKFGWLVLTTGNKSEMATGYATLYGDMAGGFAVIKDVPKTLVYALCRDRNAAARPRGDPARPCSTKPPSAELRPDQTDDRLAAAVRRARPDHRGLRRGRPLRRRARSRAGFDAAIVRRVARLVDRNEYKRRQAPPGVRVSPQGVRQGPPAADHQPLARLTRVACRADAWRTRAAAPARARADRGDDRCTARRSSIVQDALDDVDAGRVHPAAVRDRRDRARAVRAPARLAPARASTTTARATFVLGGASRSASSASPATGSRTSGSQHTTTSNSAFITGLFVVFTPLIEAVVTRRVARRRASCSRSACRRVGLFLLTGRVARLRPRATRSRSSARSLFARASRADGRVLALASTSSALTAVQLAAVAVPCLVLVAVRRRARPRRPGESCSRSRSTPASSCSAVAFIPAALGAAPRRADPRRR